jgi:hypothetical protein
MEQPFQPQGGAFSPTNLAQTRRPQNADLSKKRRSHSAIGMSPMSFVAPILGNAEMNE